MKKLGLIVLVAICGAATAFAGTVVIPFFVDTAGTTWTDGLPTAPGTASYIQAINQTGGTITCTVSYALSDGTSAGPDSGNTFVLTDGQGVSWRPGNDDSTQETTQARAIGNMNVAFPFQAGSCTITWTGAGTDIVTACKSVSSWSAGLAFMYGPFLGVD